MNFKRVQVPNNGSPCTMDRNVLGFHEEKKETEDHSRRAKAKVISTNNTLVMLPMISAVLCFVLE
jgi:hypothetical protein